MISAITNRGHLCFRLFTGNANADLFIDFMRRLRRLAKKKVFLIVDGHPTHRARKTTKWLEKHADEIRLIFLPAYSPELNPDDTKSVRGMNVTIVISGKNDEESAELLRMLGMPFGKDSGGES